MGGGNSSLVHEERFGVDDLLCLFDYYGEGDSKSGEHRRQINLVIRDGRAVQHNLCGLEINEDNLDDFLKNVNKTASQDSQQIRKLQNCLNYKRAWIVTGGLLDEIELLWTGESREHRVWHNPDQEYVVQFAITSFISSNEHNTPPSSTTKAFGRAWNQMQNLSYVAVAVSAVEVLKSNAKSVKNWVCQPDQCYTPEKDKVLGLLDSVRKASARECLFAALRGTRMMTCQSTEPEEFLTGPGWMSSVQRPGLEGALVNFAVADYPWIVYKRCKAGRKEPTVSFPRCSRHFGRQQLRKQTRNDWRNNWPGISTKTASNTDAVLAFADNGVARNYSTASLCVFLMDVIRDQPQNSATPPEFNFDVAINAANVLPYVNKWNRPLRFKATLQSKVLNKDLISIAIALESVNESYAELLNLSAESWRNGTISHNGRSGVALLDRLTHRLTVEPDKAYKLIHDLEKQYDIESVIDQLRLAFAILQSQQLAPERLENEINETSRHDRSSRSRPKRTSLTGKRNREALFQDEDPSASSSKRRPSEQS